MRTATHATQAIALILTALALIPAGAHLFALPNKIDLVREQYFIVQGIYRGRSLFGFVLIPAILVDLVLVVMLRGRGASFTFAVVAFLCLAATLAIFFIWTYPANVATDQWTTIPDNWVELRRQWEISHAVNAVLTFFSCCALTTSVAAAGIGARGIAPH